MKIIHRIFFSVMFVLTASIAYGQRPSLVAADLAYAKGDYYDAATLYKKAFTKEKNKIKRAEVIFKVAESYRMTNDYKNQEVWYAKAMKANTKDPMSVLRLADALKMNGKYDEAIVQYTNYKKMAPTDDRADLGIESSTQAQKWRDKPTRYKLENVAPINTKYSDFGISYSNKDHRHVIFSSARQESIGKNNDGWTGEKFQDLFEATVDKKGKWSSPKPLLEPINSNASEGGSSLDSKGDDLYFTRCETEKGKIGICEIYFTTRKGATWDEPKLMVLGPDSATVGHPSLSADGQTLYFSSDMVGGQGGKDIWITRYDKKSKEWSKAVNAGNNINTDLDEMFPYVTSDGTLYFSSKGHIGMGGLDVFMVKQTGGVFGEPENLKYPVNSSNDDFAFVIDEISGDRGYLSSDRDGGKGGDDIYSWHLPPLLFTVSGKVFDADSKANLEGTTIELFGSDGSSIPFKTDKTGAYKFDLKPETSYKVSANLPNYLTKYIEVSTVGIEQSKDFIGDFDFALRSTLRAIELPEVYYDLAKWDLRPESKKSLDGLLQTLNENPTIVVELGSHTDSRPIPMTNDTLSTRRAESVVKYLIEKGIPAERLEYKGYGAHEPRVLLRDVGSFHAGDSLDDGFIGKLKSNKIKEEAHQLNRRTEFKVLRTNYVKGQTSIDNATPDSLSEIQKESPSPDGAPPKKEDVPEIKPDDKKAESKDAAPAPVEAPATKDNTSENTEKKDGPGEIYTAKKIDTYTTVSKKYSITVKDLKTLNGLKGEEIYEGMELKVTMGGDYSAYDKNFYTLEKGEDNWTKVAKKLDMKAGDLKKLNKGLDESSFRIGKKVRIAQ